jgi:hypothetical protein
MLEAIRINNIDEILKKPDDAARIDPVTENTALMYGKAIRAFPDQDHDAHIAVHLQFLQDPMLAGNPGAAAMQPIMIAHIAEHIALLYRQRMQASIGVSLPTLPELRDPKFKFEDINPEMDRLISERAAEVVAKAPQMQAIAPLAKMMEQQQQQQQNPLQYAQELAKLEAEALKARTEVQIQADQAKAQQKLAINEAEAKQDLQIEQAKLQADLQAKVAKLELELQMEREKNQVEIQKEIMKDANINNPTG